MAVVVADATAPEPPDRIPVTLWKELLLLGAVILVYQASRHVGMGDPYENARQIWAMQQAIGITIEAPLQQWLLLHPWLIRILAWYYMPMHLIPFFALFLWHLFGRTAAYPYFRAAAVTTILPAFLMFMVFPLAPPRLLPEVGVIDLVGQWGGITLTTSWLEGGANQYAAFPSNHVIWAVLVSWALVRLHSVRWWPFALLHVGITMFGVVATGHHFLVDVVAGLVYAVVVIGLVDLALLTPHLQRLDAARLPSNDPERRMIET